MEAEASANQQGPTEQWPPLRPTRCDGGGLRVILESPVFPWGGQSVPGPAEVRLFEGQTGEDD